MGYQRSIGGVLLLGLLLAGCRKEPENEPPHITIIAPTENFSFTVPDTLSITVSFSDDHAVRQLTATLLDHNNIPVVQGVSATTAADQGTITLELPVLAEQLESGTYKILATASDDELSSRQILPVHLNGVPVRLRAVLTFTSPSPDALTMYRTDSMGQTAQVASWPIDFGGATVSAAAQQIYVAGGVTGPFRALQADGLAEVWQLANQSALGFPWFTGVDIGTDGRILSGTSDGTLRSLIASNGTGGIVAHLPTDYQALQSTTVGDLLVCIMEHRITHEKRLGTFFNGSGELAESHMLTLDPVVMLPLDAGRVLLFGNSNGSGMVQRMTVSGGSYSDLYTWPTSLSAASPAGAGVWAVALANGQLRNFTYPNTGSLSLLDGMPIRQMDLDRANGVLYAAGDGQLRAIDPQTGIVLGTWSVPGEVRKVLCLLNK